MAAVGKGFSPHAGQTASCLAGVPGIGDLVLPEYSLCFSLRPASWA